MSGQKELNVQIRYHAPLHGDWRWGPWDDIETALSQIPVAERVIGLWVFLSTGVRYIFKSGVQDSDLILDGQGQSTGFVFLEPATLTIGTSPGFAVNGTSAVFDGTNGTSDWRGWGVNVDRRGVGPLVQDTEFTWNITTGELDIVSPLLEGETLTITFDPKIVVPEPDSSNLDFNVSLITSDYTVQTSDFGTKLIIEPTNNLLVITLPDIATIQKNRPLMIEVGGAGCVKFVTTSGQTINFNGANSYLFVKPGETLTIYKFVRNAGTNTYEWRVSDPVGNFGKTGRTFTSYDDVTSVTNGYWLNGQALDSNIHARLYDWVTKIAGDKVCAYSDHGTGNNYLLFSLKDPATGFFYIPDTRNLFQRNSSATRDAGVYQADQVANHTHSISTHTAPQSGSSTPCYTSHSDAGTIPATLTTGNNSGGGTETNPVNFSINHFVIE